MKITIYDEDGDEHELEVPHRNEVCPDCEGEGRVLTASIREHAYTRDELFEDEDFAEEYMKGGRGIYGVACPTCAGLRVVQVPDAAGSASRQADIDLWEEQQADRAADERADRRTRWMEDGCRDD